MSKKLELRFIFKGIRSRSEAKGIDFYDYGGTEKPYVAALARALDASPDFSDVSVTEESDPTPVAFK